MTKNKKKKKKNLQIGALNPGHQACTLSPALMGKSVKGHT